MEVIFKWVVHNFTKSVKDWFTCGMNLIQTPTIKNSIWIDCKWSQTLSCLYVSNEYFALIKKFNFSWLFIWKLFFDSKLSTVVLSENPYSSESIKIHSIASTGWAFYNLIRFLESYCWLLIEHVARIVNNFKNCILFNNILFFITILFFEQSPIRWIAIRIANFDMTGRNWKVTNCQCEYI